MNPNLVATESYPNPKPCFECGALVTIKYFLPSNEMCGAGLHATYLCADHSGYDIPIKCWQHRIWTDYDTIEQREVEAKAAAEEDE